MKSRIITIITIFLIISASACTVAPAVPPLPTIHPLVDEDARNTPSMTKQIPGVSPSPRPALPVPATATSVSQQVVPRALIQPTDLEYLGAFRLPGPSGGSSWEYSGRGLTYFPGGNPQGEADGFPGSLFGVGHDQQQFVSEISIPVPVISKNLQDLPTAATLQPFADITQGMFGQTEIPRLGIQYLPARGAQARGGLFFVHGQHFQGFEPSHGWSGLNLAQAQPAGPWFLDGYTNYVTSDYIFEIPDEWAALIPGAPRLAGGRFREGVWGGLGPALFAFDPLMDGELPAPQAVLDDVVPLLLYGVQEPGLSDIVTRDEQRMTRYNADDSWWGGAWLTSDSGSAVIFSGTKASGRWWYGFANGVEWEYDCAEHTPPTCPQVPPWPYENRGYWAESYAPQIIFYNPADLVAVANGSAPTWQPQPYAALDLSEVFLDPRVRLEDYKTDLAGAVAYDREHSLMYVVERLADGYQSVIHAWKIH